MILVLLFSTADLYSHLPIYPFFRRGVLNLPGNPRVIKRNSSLSPNAVYIIASVKPGWGKKRRSRRACLGGWAKRRRQEHNAQLDAPEAGAGRRRGPTARQELPTLHRLISESGRRLSAAAG